MKKIKLAVGLTLVSVIPCLVAGCASPASLAKALAKDNANVYISVIGWGGNVQFYRANPGTNQVSVGGPQGITTKPQ